METARCCEESGAYFDGLRLLDDGFAFVVMRCDEDVWAVQRRELILGRGARFGGHG